MITSNDRFVKLFPEAVERIADDGVEKAIAEVRAVPSGRDSRRNRPSCDHFSSDEEVLADVQRASFRPGSLTWRCCWKAICRVRALTPQAIDEETWREICKIRGYLHGRQNPRGFQGTTTPCKHAGLASRNMCPACSSYRTLLRFAPRGWGWVRCGENQHLRMANREYFFRF